MSTNMLRESQAAIALANRVMRGEDGACARITLQFLTLGGSQFPLDELLAAGVNMRSPAPVEQAIAHFGKLVDKLQRNLPSPLNQNPSRRNKGIGLNR